MELAIGNTKGKRVMHKDVYCPEQMFVENNRIENIDIYICSPLKRICTVSKIVLN